MRLGITQCRHIFLRFTGKVLHRLVFHRLDLLSRLFASGSLTIDKNTKSEKKKCNTLYLKKGVLAAKGTKTFELTSTTLWYYVLYNNNIDARALIGQSAMVYCADKPMEKSRVY